LRLQLGAVQGCVHCVSIDVVDADVADRALPAAVLAVPAVDQVDQRIAHALDGGDVQLHRAGLVVEAPGAHVQRALVGGGGILHADRDGADGRAVMAGEALGKGVLLGVDDEVDAALAIQGHVLMAVAGDRGKTHFLEQRTQRFWVRRGVFDKLKTIGTHRVVPRRKLHASLLMN
jgi:hypothetical protein